MPVGLNLGAVHQYAEAIVKASKKAHLNKQEVKELVNIAHKCAKEEIKNPSVVKHEYFKKIKELCPDIHSFMEAQDLLRKTIFDASPFFAKIKHKFTEILSKKAAAKMTELYPKTKALREEVINQRVLKKEIHEVRQAIKKGVYTTV